MPWVNKPTEFEPGMGRGMGRMRLRDKLGPGWRAKMGICPFTDDIPPEVLKETPEYGPLCKQLRDIASAFVQQYDAMSQLATSGKPEDTQTAIQQLNTIYDEMMAIVEQVERVTPP